MLKEAIEKIEKMSEAHTYQCKTKIFSDKPLTFVTDMKDKAKAVQVSGINSIVSLIDREIDKINAPLFVEVAEYNEIVAYSTLDDALDRQFLYKAVSDVPAFSFGWKEHAEAMIVFRSRFKPTLDLDYILTLLGKITDNTSITSEDNGLSQSVEVKKGVALKDREYIKPIVKLCPYRTFLEIEQPESEFLLRLQEGNRIGLIEADGGSWKREAKKRIAEKLNELMADLVESGKVVVMY